MESENAHEIGEYGKRYRGTQPYPVYVTKANTGSAVRDPTKQENHRLSALAHTPTPAREKSLNFFAFEQQQMGNWPINCCDDLGLPISARSF